MTNPTYTERRRQALEQHLTEMLGQYSSGNWEQGAFEAWVETIAAYVEQEVRSAFGRGRHPVERTTPARRPGEIRSAVQHGKLKRTVRGTRVPKHFAE